MSSSLMIAVIISSNRVELTLSTKMSKNKIILRNFVAHKKSL